jgi:hypothetical protein
MKDENKQIIVGTLIGLGFIGTFVGILYLARNKVKTVASMGIDYVFNKEQEAFLKDLNPMAVTRFKKFIADVEQKLGYKVIITSGYRDFKQQAKEHAANAKNAPAGRSYHNYGLAIDINLVKGTKVINKSSPMAVWADSGVLKIAKDNGLTWGGSFAGYYDPVHFDLQSEVSINTLVDKAIRQFGSLENTVGNKVSIA